jgi:hypothetical protein
MAVMIVKKEVRFSKFFLAKQVKIQIFSRSYRSTFWLKEKNKPKQGSLLPLNPNFWTEVSEPPK